ncbi:hypothetical protein FA13DRAFT_9480 [Coprinellus micaceus]|uniref:Uncharacterized protein n=1 Tax=Coprinellus micaceus TaxID=71717 RepID=A0A4Y7TZY4_COPMI|nr:hypothetical protein FA13DRAFT_9480 [Coprinellus micaceus]
MVSLCIPDRERPCKLLHGNTLKPRCRAGPGGLLSWPLYISNQKEPGSRSSAAYMAYRRSTTLFGCLCRPRRKDVFRTLERGSGVGFYIKRYSPKPGCPWSSGMRSCSYVFQHSLFVITEGRYGHFERAVQRQTCVLTTAVVTLPYRTERLERNEVIDAQRPFRATRQSLFLSSLARYAGHSRRAFAHRRPGSCEKTLDYHRKHRQPWFSSGSVSDRTTRSMCCSSL